MVFASIVDMTPTKGIEINQAFIFLAQRVEKLRSFSNLEWVVLRKKKEDQLSVWSRRIYVKDFS